MAEKCKQVSGTLFKSKMGGGKGRGGIIAITIKPPTVPWFILSMYF